MKILVTGGAGFIGKHLCRELKAKSYSVKVLDLRSVEASADVRDPATVDRFVSDADAVFHLAAMVSVPLCQEQPLESYRTNLLGTVNVLEAIRKTGKKIPVIFAGSSAVYGYSGEKPEPLSEGRPLGSPLSFYAAQKLGAEEMLRLYHKNFQVPVTVFRFFNVYGPGQDPSSPYSGVISIFNSRITKDECVTLNGGGTQTRDWGSVHDVVKACVLALDLPKEKCDGQPINLGSGQSTSVREIAEMIAKIKGKTLKMQSAPRRPEDIPHSLANISRARMVLGWTPEVSLESGLRELE
jgi:UDP-glucose 4-epimerase